MVSLTCPSCGSEMQTKHESDLSFDVCKSCDGIFLDKGELNDLAIGMAGDIEYCSIQNQIDPKVDSKPNRTCPKCDNQAMRKINLLRLSDVIFDFCPKCEGIFLDKNEIKQMNSELRVLSGDGINDEIRKEVNGHLLRVDEIGGTVLAPKTPMGDLSGVNTTSFRITLYYKQPLDVGLRITRESWNIKLLKLFGLFKEQDIEINNSKMNSSFIIKGEDINGIKNILNDENLQNELLKFISEKPKIHLIPGTLEVLDACIVYTEGPYSGEFSIDIQKSSKEVIKRLEKIVSNIES